MNWLGRWADARLIRENALLAARNRELEAAAPTIYRTFTAAIQRRLRRYADANVLAENQRLRDSITEMTLRGQKNFEHCQGLEGDLRRATMDVIKIARGQGIRLENYCPTCFEARKKQ